MEIHEPHPTYDLTSPRCTSGEHLGALEQVLETFAQRAAEANGGEGEVVAGQWMGVFDHGTSMSMRPNAGALQTRLLTTPPSHREASAKFWIERPVLNLPARDWFSCFSLDEIRGGLIGRFFHVRLSAHITLLT